MSAKFLDFVGSYFRKWQQLSVVIIIMIDFKVIVNKSGIIFFEKDPNSIFTGI